MPQQIETNILKEIEKSRTFRHRLASFNHLWFFRIYLNHYLTYKMAPFQREMFKITEDESNQLTAVMAFRGSGKSTIMNLSFVLWSILGRLQKKFVIIISNNKNQSFLQLENIYQELTGNELLKKDFGPLIKETDQRTNRYLIIPKYNAKIMSITTKQSIRGLRSGQYRPDLIICDDIEDSSAPKNLREAILIYNWFKNEILSGLEPKTRIIVIGNLLHRDSFLTMIKDIISCKRINGIFCSYPIIDKNKNILWPDKFKSLEDLHALEKSIGDKNIWKWEYELTYPINLGEEARKRTKINIEDSKSD